MPTLSNFVRTADPIIASDLANQITASIGKAVTVEVTPDDILVTGAAIITGDRAAIQAVITVYAYIYFPQLNGTVNIPLLTNLKAYQPYNNAIAFLVGKNNVSDNLGGFYRWDSTATGAEDTQFMNIIPSNLSSTGRWVRIFQKAKTYPQGPMVSNGGVKALFTTGTTNSSGNITINLTDDGTATGTALFTEVWSIMPQPQTDATGPSDAVQAYRKSLAADLKTATFGFYKANALTITLGLLYNPFASIGAGTNVAFRVEGV